MKKKVVVEQHPVTVKEWAEWLKSLPPKERKSRTPDRWAYQRECPWLPVVRISQSDAVEYAKWRGTRLPRDRELGLAYKAGVVRVLPALYEWVDPQDGVGASRGGHYGHNGVLPRAARRFVDVNARSASAGLRVCAEAPRKKSRGAGK